MAGRGTLTAALLVGNAVSIQKTAAGFIHRGWLTSAQAQSWGKARQLLGQQGFAKPQQILHHAFISQKRAGTNRVLRWLANQRWNLRPLDQKLAAQLARDAIESGGAGTMKSGNALLSNLVHGNTAHKLNNLKWGLRQRLMEGTPTWAFGAEGLVGMQGIGRTVNYFGGIVDGK